MPHPQSDSVKLVSVELKDNGGSTSSKTFPDRSQKNNDKGSSLRIVLLSLMVAQNTAAVLLGSYSRANKTKDQLYVVNHLVLASEIGKFFLSTILEMSQPTDFISTLKTHVFDNPLDCLKISIPSLLYVLQNTLLYVALSNLSAPMFQVTYQSKLLTTALLSKFMLNRIYSTKQWICLVTLGLGVAIVVLGGEEKSSGSAGDSPPKNYAVGLVSVTISCFSSAMAGVFFEMVLKKKSKSDGAPAASMWMRNIQMSFFSIVLALIQQTNLSSEDAQKPLFHGFTASVWLVVIVQSCGGLLVAAIIKYADNVLKGMATGVSILASSIGSTIIFGTSLHFQFGLGALMILSSVYLFSNDLPSFLAQKIWNKKSLDNDSTSALLSKV